MDFYFKFIELCNSVGKSPSKVALEIGTSKPAVTRWKSGSTPSDAVILKIADYFDVSVEYLKGETDEKKKPSADKGEELTNEKRLLLALFDQIPKEKQAEAIKRFLEVLNNP